MYRLHSRVFKRPLTREAAFHFGRATLVSVFPIYYAFAAPTVVMYGLMKTTFTDGKVYTFLRGRLRSL